MEPHSLSASQYLSLVNVHLKTWFQLTGTFPDVLVVYRGAVLIPVTQLETTAYCNMATPACKQFYFVLCLFWKYIWIFRENIRNMQVSSQVFSKSRIATLE